MQKSIGLALLMLAANWASAQPGMGPTLVEAVTVGTQDVRDAVNAVGSLQANEAVIIRPEIAGRVERVQFMDGQRIQKGAVLFTLDDSVAAAEVREWKATVAQSQREAARATDLVKRKLLSQNDFETKRAQQEVDQARLASAQTRLDKSTIRAPFTGVVGLRLVSPGEYVQAGTALVNLVQLDPIKVEFRLPERLLSRVRAGLAVRAQLDAFPGKSFDGRIYAIDPQIDPQSRTVKLRASLDNKEGVLRPGLFANVSIVLAERLGRIVIPEQALWPQNGQQMVYLVQAGKAVLRPVVVGKREAGKVEINEGLAVGEQVIIAGQLKIGPGSPVQVAGAKTTSPAVPAKKP